MLNIDWSKGCASDGGDKNCRRIIITGDWVPCWDIARGSFYDSVMAEHPVECYGETLDVLKAADLNIVNLECAIDSKSGTPAIKSGPHLCAEERHLPCLQAGCFHVAALANNHIFDYGVEGFKNTCATLDKLKMRYFGAGLDDAEAWKPLVCNVDGLRVGLVGFTEGHDFTAATPGKPGVAGWEVARAREAIREAKRQSDVVIVIPHGGIEYAAHPSKYCIDTYRALAEEQPDAIVAHHPHVPQGIEIYRGVPIFYSLGNYLFHHMTPLHYRRHGYLVELAADRDGVHGFKCHPYLVGHDGLELLHGVKRDRFFATIEKVSRPFSPGEDPYSGFHATLKYRWQTTPFSQFTAVAKHFDSNPVKAAAMLRSRLTTLQNTGLNIPMYDRVVKGLIDDAPDWALEMEREYMTREL
jgi:poly-gamma-glutamate synthesis protein (capsule biosynthesis protein)